MSYIDDRIAELEQRIAEKRAYQRMYPSHKYASTWDYVAEGDRSGFDRMDAQEAAYRNMLSQQAQQLNVLKAQQEFNAEENALNRKNTMDIAKMNKALALDEKQDEWIRLRGKALSGLQYAEQSLKYAMDRGDANAINAAERDVQLAKEDLAYYNSKLGYKEPTKAVSNEPKPSLDGQETPVNLSVDIERFKAFTKGKKAEIDAILEEIKSNPNFNQSPELQAQYQRISKIKSDEQLLEELNKRRSEWEEGKKLTGYDYRKWKESPKGKKLIAEFGE